MGAAAGHGWSEKIERGLRKRSVTIAGHRTSISLEPEFWAALEGVAARRRCSLARLIGEIDRSRAGRSLSSSLRVYLLAQATRAREEV